MIYTSVERLLLYVEKTAWDYANTFPCYVDLSLESRLSAT